MNKKTVFSVGEVNKYVHRMFDEDFLLQSIRVQGEVSNCKYHTSGHVYFTLKDPTGALACVMFKTARMGLTFKMKDGDRVICDGSVSVYEQAGKYQLYVRSIVKDGEGELFLRYEALRKELEEMGMFAPQYKKKIPPFARRIGIVTAQTGAAIRDIENIARRRNPYVELVLCPAIVQGEYAAASIISGIRTLDEMGLDVLIVGRGGGSMEDLFAFNEEPVVRAVFECNTPVISAVGHESDTVLTDFAADLRAPTPSAAAELAVFDIMELKRTLEAKRSAMNRALSLRLSRQKEKLLSLEKRLLRFDPEKRLTDYRLRMDELWDRLKLSLEGKLTDTKEKASVLSEKLNIDIEEKIRSKREELKRLSEALDKDIEMKIRSRRERFVILAERLNGVSPLKRISEGYAFLYGKDKKQIRSVKTLEKGSSFTACLKDGIVKATVDSTEEISYGRTERKDT